MTNIKDILVYVGTYTRGESKGVYIYRLNRDNGGLEPLGYGSCKSSPSFLAFSPGYDYLYAANEIGEYQGERSGALAVWSIDQETGELDFINQSATGGPGPCYVTVDATGKYAFAANYSGGSVAMIPINEDGSLAPASDFVQHVGSSVNERRQGEAHAHSCTIDPTNKYALVADLGMDKIMVYKLDLENGKLVPNDTPFVRLHGGAGPRHFCFSPCGRYGYVINELDSTVTSFVYDADAGTLETIETVSTLPDGWEGQSHCADIHMLSSGRFLYGSNRGHDSIVIMSVDTETGKLTPVGWESTQGNFPRNFCIDPTETFLLAANQNTDNIVSYRIDQETGLLTPTGQETQVPIPVCIKMWARS